MYASNLVAINRMWLISPRLALILTLPDPAPHVIKAQQVAGH